MSDDYQANDVAEQMKHNNFVAAVDVGAADMAYITALSNAITERLGNDLEKSLLLIVGGSEIGNDDGVFLLLGSEDGVKEVGASVAKVLCGRGGGRGGKFQGKGSQIRSHLDDARTVLSQYQEQ